MQSLVTDFAEFCGVRDVDPEETLAILNTQDWKGAKEDLTPITDEQLKAINRSLKEIVGEPTDEQLKAIFHSVMAPSSPAATITALNVTVGS